MMYAQEHNEKWVHNGFLQASFVWSPTDIVWGGSRAHAYTQSKVKAPMDVRSNAQRERMQNGFGQAISITSAARQKAVQGTAGTCL